MAEIYVKNCWYVAAWDYEVPAGTIFTMSILGEPLVLYRRNDGGVTVLEDKCCHRLAPLSKGRLEDGCNIRCMYHGMKFDSEGACIEIPGQNVISAAARVRSYPVVERHSWIWVWMGDPAAADPNLIPPAVGLDDPRYVLKSASLDYAADYELINDNLTDFSHLAYVHANSMGATETWALVRPTIRRLDRGIRVSRWLKAGENMRDLEERKGLADYTSRSGAHWQTYDYLAPGILLMANEYYDESQKPEDGVSPPTGEPFMANFTSHAVTPMGKRSTRYFFSFGPRTRDGGTEMAQAMVELAKAAFVEDRDMIEAQQRIIDMSPSREFVIGADVGPIQMRSVIRDLIKAEGRAPGPSNGFAQELAKVG